MPNAVPIGPMPPRAGSVAPAMGGPWRRARDRVTVIAPDGRLTVDTVSALRESVRELVEGGALHVIVDMSSVTFMDTVGLAGILGGMKSTREQGGDLRIAGANEMVRE